ncbi:ATP-binding protein [Catenulispora rubra]|uniref:ATP-binding protein n=1 Tax=Catenulispora rubra TaxID=280293 RepID=UPI00189220DF|nr:ATP-binding protein [Catenulispora rubra]
MAALAEAGAAEEAAGLRMVVVVGTAGAGKTSLVMRFAHQVRASFPHGDLFVDLRGYDAGAPVPPTAALERFLRALGVPTSEIPQDLEDRAGLYRSLLAGRRMLVVLDNAATPGQIRPLLPGDGAPLVLVTSRSRLSGLTARDGARRVSVGLLDQAGAVALIRAATSDYRSSDDSGQIAELAELCARLPLALRIAAERAAARPFMALGDLVAELRSGPGLWQALSADDDQEADAVRTVFAWSYRVLPGPAARAFRLLGLHPGPEFGSGAAAALLGLPHQRARLMLDTLAGAHLLEQTSAARFQFHDLLRAFAADVAAADEPEDERQEAFRRLHEWYLHSARAASALTQNVATDVVDAQAPPEVEPERFGDYRQAVDWYAVEHTNLRGLIRSLEQAGDGGAVYRLAATIWPLTFTFGSADERLSTALAALRGARATDDLTAQARALRNVASSERLTDDLTHSRVHYREALAAFESLDNPAGSADAANGLGLVLFAERHLDEALLVFTEAAEHARADGQAQWAAILRSNVAHVMAYQGLAAAAIEVGEQALSELATPGRQGSAILETYSTIARAYIELERWDQALTTLDTADRIISADGADPLLQALLLIDRAELALAMGQPADAEGPLWQAQNLGRALHHRDQQARMLSAIGRTLHALGRTAQAADFHRQAVASSRGRHDRFRLADVLSRLADTLDALDQGDEAAAARTEATTLLSGYQDPRAAGLRARLAGHGASSQP